VGNNVTVRGCPLDNLERSRLPVKKTDFASRNGGQSLWLTCWAMKVTRFAPHRKSLLHRSAAQRLKHQHRQPDNTRQKTTTQPRKTDGNPANPPGTKPQNQPWPLEAAPPKTQTRQAESEGEKPNRATARQKPSLNFAQNLTQTNCQNPGKRHSHQCRTTHPQRH